MITCQVSSIPFKVPQRNEDREEDYYVFRIFYENLFRGGVIEFVLASHNFGVTKGWKKSGLAMSISFHAERFSKRNYDTL